MMRRQSTTTTNRPFGTGAYLSNRSYSSRRAATAIATGMILRINYVIISEAHPGVFTNKPQKASRFTYQEGYSLYRYIPLFSL